MTPDDVALLEAGDGADEDAPVAHDEIFAFDQEKTKIACKISLFGIG
jgi:hypothetical protein